MKRVYFLAINKKAEATATNVNFGTSAPEIYSNLIIAACFKALKG